MIVIHAYMTIKPEHRDSFLDTSNKIMAHSRAEEGNIKYMLFEDTEKNNSFVMLEEWKDTHSIEMHEKTAHFKDFISEIQDLLSEPLKANKYEVKEKEL